MKMTRPSLRPRRSWKILVCALLCLGCGEPGPYRKVVVPVSGRILVDGSPVEGLAIRCVSSSGLDVAHPTESQCFTEKDGKFKLSTYESGDGVPPGEYVLTFQWGEWNMLTKQYSGDKLNGRYADAGKAGTKLDIKAGEPRDLGDIQLTTKE